MKICLIGNCQIEPLRYLILASIPNVGCAGLPSVHMLTPHHQSEVHRCCDEADLIWTQYISDEFFVEYVRTSYLKHFFPNRVVVFPNAYFSAYAPEYCTLQDPQRDNFRGPLFDYHSEKIVGSFISGKSIEQTLRLVENYSDYDRRFYANPVSETLSALKDREKWCDVVISDYIDDNFRRQRLFYVMNHPNLFVLKEILRRLCDYSQVRSTPTPLWMMADKEMCFAMHHESPQFRGENQVNYVDQHLARGFDLKSTEAGHLTADLTRPKLYTRLEIVEQFYLLYESHRQGLTSNHRAIQLGLRLAEI